MQLSEDEVRYVAKLARVALTDAEVEKMRDELSGILGHFEVLQRLDTEHVPPTAQVLNLQNRFEPDAARPSAPVEDILKNAPLVEDDYFRVKAVLE